MSKPFRPRYNARPVDLVEVIYALDEEVHYVLRRDLLCGAGQRLVDYRWDGSVAGWGENGLAREHIIFPDHDEATVMLQRLYAALDGWYDAAVGNQDIGDAGCFVTIEQLRELHQGTIEVLVAAGS